MTTLSFARRFALCAGSLALGACTGSNHPLPPPNGQPQVIEQPSAAPPPAPAASESGSTLGAGTAASEPADVAKPAPAATAPAPVKHAKVRRHAHHARHARATVRTHKVILEVPARGPDSTPDSTKVARSQKVVVPVDASTVSGSSEPLARPVNPRTLGPDWNGRIDDSMDMVDANEPSTMIPGHAGSTALSGEDRPSAMAGHRGTFNPAKLEAQRRWEIASATSDMERFGYKRRNAFKHAMDRMLANEEARIESLRTKVETARGPARSAYQDLLATVDSERVTARAKLRQVDEVARAKWDGYKIEFREAVGELERSVEQLRSAMR